MDHSNSLSCYRHETCGLDGITDLMDVSLSELREMVMDREAWHGAIHGVTKSWIQKISLEGMMLKLKLQYFGHLMRRVDSLAQFPARRREERGCGPVTGKGRASCQSGGAPALHPGAIAQSPGREAALAWASLAQRSPASSVLAREGAGCGSVGDVPGAWLASAPLWPSLWT